MPAYNPGSPLDPVEENPSEGQPVIMSPFSGPLGSPLDAKVYPSDVYQPVPADLESDPTNLSTGALSTGIGFGLDNKLPGMEAGSIAANGVGGYTDSYIPGVTMPDPAVAATLAVLTAIGGGKSDIEVGEDDDFSNGVSVVAPYEVQPLLAFGNDIERDAGEAEPFTGHAMKLVTAAADVAAGAAIETGFLNAQGSTLKQGLSQFGSEVAASPAVE